MRTPDAVTVTTLVEVSPAEAFALFTEDVDLWWRKEPRYRFDSERQGTLRFEPGVGGRFVEVYADASEHELGRISVWEPGARLVFGFRPPDFAPGETTEVEIRFENEGEKTRVTLEHRGWDAFAPDHPAKKDLEGPAFGAMIGAYWTPLLLQYQVRSRSV